MFKKVLLYTVTSLFLLTPINFAYDSDELKTINLYEKINPAIVCIDAKLEDGFSSGTGCFIEPDTILTSSHVIENAQIIEITTYNGEVFSGKITSKFGENDDLALIKINSNKKFATIKLGSSQTVKVGQKVLAIGHPFGFNGTLTQGIISRIDYSKNKLQTDAAINPGCSGGPILNTSGEVIGISQSIFNPDNNISNIGIGFAIPVDTVKHFIAQNKVSK